MAEDEGTKAAPVTIKKYANRRLYNMATSSYVTLGDLARMVKDGVEFVVADAKTGEDITRSVLTQIIVEEEAKGHNLLPIGFLRRIIAFYGDNMQSLLTQYLEHSMSAFTSNQERMRRYIEESFGGMFPFGPIESMGKQNIAMMEQAMRMLSPFAPPAGKEPNSGAGEAGAGVEEKRAEDRIGELQARIDALQKQLDELNRAKRG